MMHLSWERSKTASGSERREGEAPTGFAGGGGWSLPLDAAKYTELAVRTLHDAFELGKG